MKKDSDKNMRVEYSKMPSNREWYKHDLYRQRAIAAGRCMRCNCKIRETDMEDGTGSVWTNLGKMEYKISGHCEYCFDELFGAGYGGEE